MLSFSAILWATRYFCNNQVQVNRETQSGCTNSPDSSVCQLNHKLQKLSGIDLPQFLEMLSHKLQKWVRFIQCTSEIFIIEILPRLNEIERASKQERCRCKSLEDVVLNRSRLMTANSFAASKYLFNGTANWHEVKYYFAASNCISLVGWRVFFFKQRTQWRSYIYYYVPKR